MDNPLYPLAKKVSYRSQKCQKWWKTWIVISIVFLGHVQWFQEVLGAAGGSRIPYGSIWTQQGPDWLSQTSKNFNIHVLGNFNVLERILKTFHLVQGLPRKPLFFFDLSKHQLSKFIFSKFEKSKSERWKSGNSKLRKFEIFKSPVYIYIYMAVSHLFHV